MDCLLVAAIDFGTARSGYGFAFEPPGDNRDVSAPLNFCGAREGSIKTLTSILLDSNDKIKSFGYKARDDFQEMCEDPNENKECSYIENFKMSLYEEGKEADYLTPSRVPGASPKQVAVQTVIREALTFMKDKVLENVNQRRLESTNVEAKDVQWVITVPGMWSDRSKRMMRIAAEESDMGDNLMIVLEPEAAALWIRGKYPKLTAGDRYVVIDCGGGTVDFACHEVIDDFRVKETHSASGGPWGSTYLDAAYEDILRTIFGESKIKNFKKRNPDSWIELMDNWEKAKVSNYDGINIKLGDLNDLVDATVKLKLKEHNLEIKRKKLKLTKPKLHSLYAPLMESMTQHLEILLSHPDVKGSQSLFVVGGFAQSTILQNSLEETFPGPVVIPERPELAVVFGAVKCGFNPPSIAQRKCKYTYGVSTCVNFVPGKHDINKRIVTNRIPKCVDIFSAFVRKGHEIDVDHEIEKSFLPIQDDQNRMVFDIYTSPKERPMYVTDEGCKRVGQLLVCVENVSGVRRRVFCKMKFGGSEITVTGENEQGVVTNVKLEFDF